MWRWFSFKVHLHTLLILSDCSGKYVCNSPEHTVAYTPVTKQ
jgi:hypothetical protein